jgi:hypothetical protein
VISAHRLPPLFIAQHDRGPQPWIGWRPRSGREVKREWDLVPFCWAPVGVNPTETTYFRWVFSSKIRLVLLRVWGHNDATTIETTSFTIVVHRGDVTLTDTGFTVGYLHFTPNRFEFPMFKFKSHDSNISQHRFHPTSKRY